MISFGSLVINDSLERGKGLESFQARIRRLEALGFDSIAMPDSQSLWPEMYIQLSVAALATERVALWPAVTNPLTRHPAVAASAIATVEQLAPGRVWFNLGSGDSAVYNLGLKGAGLETLRSHVRAIRDLFSEGVAAFSGEEIRLKWPSRKIPIYVTAEGPKTLQMAGEFADGVLVGTGLQPDLVKDALENVAIGAERAGRDPEEIDVWWFVKWNLDDDRSRAVHEARMTLTASANHAFRFSLEGKRIPEEYKGPIMELQRRYVFSEHESVGEHKTNAQIVEELGLTQYLADRFTLCGPPSLFRRRLEELYEAGAKKVLMAYFGETDREGKHERFASEVMNAFR